MIEKSICRQTGEKEIITGFHLFLSLRRLVFTTIQMKIIGDPLTINHPHNKPNINFCFWIYQPQYLPYGPIIRSHATILGIWENKRAETEARAVRLPAGNRKVMGMAWVFEALYTERA